MPQWNQLPQALDAYRQAVRADPQNPDRYLDYTRLLMDLDRNEEAMKIYARLGDPQKAALMADETKRLMQTQREAALRLQQARLKDFQPPANNQ